MPVRQANRLASRGRPFLPTQRGSIAVMTAVLLTVLLGCTALAVDVAYLYIVRNELQNAADAAALAGAPCLNPRTECLNTKNSAPDWATAQQTATNAISLNSSTGVQLTSGTVEYGYWNLTGTPAGLQSLPMTPGSNDRPAVKVTLSRSTGQNGGPVPTFFARIFGTTSMPVSATAVAVFSIPGYAGHGSLFPVAITKCLYDNYWNSTTHSPMTATSTTSPPGFDSSITQVVGQPYYFKVTSSYHAGPCEAGQWTSLDIDSNNVPTIRGLISSGNGAGIGVGDSIWIEPGTKTSLYSSVNACSAAGDKSCEYVTVPVVQDISTHAYNPVVAFACLHILSAAGGSDKSILVQMSNDTSHCETSNSGGIGPNYGSYTPPRLVY
ncbi:hypothetical protein BKK81_06625 [Cupriavidus sp. USMAHM13]|nr:TadG family pilus assembly protein [Cupriavidus sp. USMAHM13]AOY98969.1 hypothetical protein BKK81_06625 [Cupriavidus sp. USMAHM13]